VGIFGEFTVWVWAIRTGDASSRRVKATRAVIGLGKVYNARERRSERVKM